MSEFEKAAAAMVAGIDAQNDDQVRNATLALVLEFGRLLERGVVALETMASAVDTYDRPATVRTRVFG